MRPGFWGLVWVMLLGMPMACIDPEAVMIRVADGNYASGHDVFIDTQDPAENCNYYGWDWGLYEPQEWCRSCYEGFYTVNAIKVINGSFLATDQLAEDCFYPAVGTPAYAQVRNLYFDYPCRT